MADPDQIIDAEAVEQLPVPVDEHPLGYVPANLFGPDPAMALENARAIVQRIEAMIKPRRSDFVAKIQGREYPKCDWWTAAGQPLGLSPQVAWVRPVDFLGDVEAYEARVEVYDRGGNMVSAGQAICSRAESNWKNRDTYAIYSMAQTRATGKAYRLPLSFLAVLAGLQPTPAEEMPRDTTRAKAKPPAKPQAPPRDDADDGPKHTLEQHVGKRVEGTVETIQPEDIWKPHGNRKSKWFSCEGRDVRLCTYSNPESADEAKRWGVGMVVNFKVDEIGHFPDGNDKAMVSEVRPGRLPLDDAESLGEPDDEPSEPSVSSDDGSCGYCGASAHETCKDDCTAPTPF